jgi:hypothetical protein
VRNLQTLIIKAFSYINQKMKKEGIQVQHPTFTNIKTNQIANNNKMGLLINNNLRNKNHKSKTKKFRKKKYKNKKKGIH